MLQEAAAFLTGRSLAADSLVLLVLAGLFCSLYYAVLDMQVWRHDALVMLPDYLGQLKSEGRWLNYLFFPWLKRLPPQFSIFLCLAFWGCFSFIAARRFTTDRRLCALFVLLSLQLPAFYSVAGWPSTILSAYAVTAAMAYLADRLGMKAVFFWSGFLLFGTFNNFYNLILLLYLKDIAESDFRSVVKIFFFWALFFVAGYVCMLVITWLIGGHWGLLIADWRHPHYVHCLHDILINVKTVWHSLKDNLRLAGPLSMVLCLAGVCLLSCVKDVLTGRKGRKVQGLFILCALCAVAAAGYVQSVPFGLGVADRTAVGLYAALFVLALFLCTRCRTIGLAFILAIALNEYGMNVDSIRYYTGLTNTWLKSVQSMNVNPAAARGVHICSDKAQVRAAEEKLVRSLDLHNYSQEWFADAWRQRSVFQAAGFRQYDVRQDLCPRADQVQRQGNGIHSWVYREGELYVWYE